MEEIIALGNYCLALEWASTIQYLRSTQYSSVSVFSVPGPSISPILQRVTIAWINVSEDTH